MKHYIIMCRSLTYAQRAVRVLERAGIFASLLRGSLEMTEGGCSYGVKVRERDLIHAQSLIAAAGIAVGRTFPLPEQEERR